jgi:hypothetical protein
MGIFESITKQKQSGNRKVWQNTPSTTYKCKLNPKLNIILPIRMPRHYLGL